MLRVFLIRHGESIANIGGNYVERIPDHLIRLSEKGKQQAHDAGIWLANYCSTNGICLDHARIWKSPYLRTRQTAEEFNKFLNITDIKENITISEQQFGLFDCIRDEDRKKLFPLEYEEYQRQRQNQGKFYARLPLGESPYDVSIRVYQFVETVRRDYEKYGIDTVFVFTHGTALRAVLLRWFDYTPEWYHDERNPGNCWIREINDDTDCGYINL